MQKGKKSRPVKKGPKRGEPSPRVTIPCVPSVSTNNDESVLAETETTDHMDSPLGPLSKTPMWDVVSRPKSSAPQVTASRESEDSITKALRRVRRDRLIDRLMRERTKKPRQSGPSIEERTPLTRQDIERRESLTRREAQNAVGRHERTIRKYVEDGLLTSTGKKRIRVDAKWWKLYNETHGKVS